MAKFSESLSNNEKRDQLQYALDERFGGERRYIWLRDFGDDWIFYELSGADVSDPGNYTIGYSVDDSDVVTLEDADPVEVIAKVTYVPKPQPTSESAEDVVGDCIPLVEATVRRDGTVPIKLIEDGWSENGRYYSADVLERDGATAFPAGTHMFWDHPTASEESDRPERSLRDLAAVLVSDAHWMAEGPAGSGLYADAKPIADYAPLVEELAPHIGVSIRASGYAHAGEADGQAGQIIERIAVGKSVDFVTTPAAGGEIVSLFESVRASGPPQRKETPMPEPKNPTDLAEAQRELTEARRQFDEATALGTIAAAERDRYREQLVLHEATDVVVAELIEAKLPDITKKRLVESVSLNPPTNDKGELDKDKLKTRVEEAIKAEREYLATLRGTGHVRGLGDTDDTTVTESDASKTEERLTSAFARIGLSESAAKNAAAGRR